MMMMRGDPGGLSICNGWYRDYIEQDVKVGLPFVWLQRAGLMIICAGKGWDIDLGPQGAGGPVLF